MSQSGKNSEPTNPIQDTYSLFFLADIVTTFTGPSVTFFCLPASHVLWADQDFALTFHGSFGTSATRALTNSELPELRHARAASPKHRSTQLCRNQLAARPDLPTWSLFKSTKTTTTSTRYYQKHLINLWKKWYICCHLLNDSRDRCRRIKRGLVPT